MVKLSLNQAAKEAGVAKKTVLEAIRRGALSGPKNEKGHYEIDPAELFRVYPKPGTHRDAKPRHTPSHHDDKPSESSAVEGDVEALHTQMALLQEERARERGQLEDQIEALRAQLERQSADHRQALAIISDLRPKASATLDEERPRFSILDKMLGRR